MLKLLTKVQDFFLVFWLKIHHETFLNFFYSSSLKNLLTFIEDQIGNVRPMAFIYLVDDIALSDGTDIDKHELLEQLCVFETTTESVLEASI